MLSRLYRYGQWPNSHDLLKSLAIVLMVIDHLGAFVFTDQAWMRIVGRGAAPLFFFLVGYFPPKAATNSLVVFGIILTMQNYYLKGRLFVNILLNFVLIKGFLSLLHERYLEGDQLRSTVLLLLLLNPFAYGYIEYGTSGLLFALSARLIVAKNPMGTTYLIVALCNHFFIEYIAFAHQMTFGNDLLFAFTFSWISYFLVFYKLRDWQTPMGTRSVIMLLSRYSLAIYFWHVLLYCL